MGKSRPSQRNDAKHQQIADILGTAESLNGFKRFFHVLGFSNTLLVTDHKLRVAFNHSISCLFVYRVKTAGKFHMYYKEEDLIDHPVLLLVDENFEHFEFVTKKFTKSGRVEYHTVAFCKSRISDEILDKLADIRGDQEEAFNVLFPHL